MAHWPLLVPGGQVLPAAAEVTVLPRMQGKELADKIRILQPDARVLFMSGYTQGLLGAQGVLEPGVQLIEKPFSEATLLTKLNEILSDHS
jgi:hypothetical protein